MKKKFLQVLFIVLFFIFSICYFSNIAFANNENYIPVSCSKADLYYTTSWGNREVLATTSSIYEVIGSTNTPLSTLPKIILESTDGTVQQWVYVEKQGEKTYFDVVFDNLDFSKSYIFKVKSTSPGNMSDFQQITLLDDFIDISSKNTYVTIKNSIITFSNTYSAPVSCSKADLYYTTSWGNREVLATTSSISEVIGNSKISVSTLPKIILESTDGTIQEWVYVEKQGEKTYFDVVFGNLDFSKNYIFKVKSTSSGNTADFQQLTLLDDFIDISSKNTYITVKNSVITFSNTYSAPVSCSKADLYYTTSWGNRKVLAAASSISEVIGNSKISLSTLPKVILESTDGKIQEWVYVEKQGEKTYFDVVFDNLDFSKSYIFKVKSTSPGNTSGFEQLTLLDNFITIPSKNTYITVKDNIITFSNKCNVPISCSKADLYYTTSWGNREVLATSVSMTEIVNGTQTPVSTLPKVILESTDGKVQEWVYVEKQGEKIYFDVVFDKLDFSKNYIFKVKSNLSGNSADFVQISLLDDFIPISSKNIYVTIKDNIISFSNNYNADLSFKPVDLYFVQDANYNTYIAGMADIFVKSANGSTFLPPTLPNVELRANDESVYKACYVEKVGNKYYFSVMLDDLDLTKAYYIKMKDTSTNNLSTVTAKNLWINSINNNLHTYTASETNSYITFAQKMIMGKYGVSGLKVKGDSRGSDLKYYKIGHGENVLFAVFAIHGYEDLWAKDSKELTIIAEDFAKNLSLSNDEKIMNNWTVYVFPQANPDGANYGYTNNGAGRCTLTGVNGHSVDMNRCWSSGFVPTYSNRNYTGSQPFEAYEARYLRDFMLQNKSKNGQTVLIDLHGWTTQLIGDRGICLNYYGPQFYGSYNNSLSKYTSSYGSGYMINWARNNLSNSKGVPARSALIELPSAGIYNHNSVVNARYSQKYYNATVNMLKGLL